MNLALERPTVLVSAALEALDVLFELAPVLKEFGWEAEGWNASG